jgi:hypothetical protein
MVDKIVVTFGRGNPQVASAFIHHILIAKGCVMDSSLARARAEALFKHADPLEPTERWKALEERKNETTRRNTERLRALRRERRSHGAAPQ